MKEVWMCRWETIPGDGEHLEKYPTLEAAKKAVRQKISQCIDLSEYLADLGPDAAKYLGTYLSDPTFPHREADIPKDYEEPEHGDLALYPGRILWDHPYEAHPYLNTDLVLKGYDADSYFFDFWYNYPEEADGKGVTALSIRIFPKMEYGTSAYPLMILQVLDATPRTQQQIMQRVYERYGTKIDRKAVSRHLNLLKELGFRVEQSREGYYLKSA